MSETQGLRTDAPPEASAKTANPAPTVTPLSDSPNGSVVGAVPPAAGAMRIRPLAQIVQAVDHAPARSYLFRPIWTQDAYGMISGEDKAGKSWAVLDAGVSAASGTAWLGLFTCEASGPVLMFLGEGGEAKTVRRLRAICAARGLSLEALPIRIAFRVPHLTSREHLEEVAREVEAHPPALIILDPLYLAARGARASQLYEMGEHLEAIQTIAQNAGAALMLSHHYRKDRSEKGRWRMSGVGPGAWGRVLVSADVERRATEGHASIVTLALEIVGDETEDTRTRLRRRVWADDPNDLSSPLNYTIEPLADEPAPAGESDLRPSTRRVLAILDAADYSLKVRELGDRLANDGTGIPLRPRTIQAALDELRDKGLADAKGDPALGLEWVRTTETAPPEVENAW